jgi:hypothetical protein
MGNCHLSNITKLRNQLKKKKKTTGINVEKELAKNSTFCTGNGIFFLMRIPKLHYKFMSHHCFLMYPKEYPTL